MKKFTVLLEGGRNLTLTGTESCAVDEEECIGYIDDAGSHYTIYKRHIVAVVEEPV